MVKKIKSSLRLKIFTSIFVILMVISLVIFGIVRTLMLGIYEQRLDAELFYNANQLMMELSHESQDEWEQMLTDFQLVNSASVTIRDAQGTQIFGTQTVIVEPGSEGNYSGGLINVIEGMEGIESGSTTIGNLNVGSETSMLVRVEPRLALAFVNDNQSFLLEVTSLNITTILSQVGDIFTQIFVIVLIIIVIVAIITAHFYTRFLGKPIVEIAHISKKMTDLDFVWQCETNRTDEIGLLASNLNQMADQLNTTLSELKSANTYLQDEIRREREHERRRRDFFAAVSHELKTPVTILKGELDGMILNVGKFKDRDKYLLEAYKTNESIEKLVREIMKLAQLDTIRLNLESVNLSTLVSNVVKQYVPLAEDKQLSIEVNSNDDIQMIADRTQLQTVISNVVGNAVRYSVFAGNIDINFAINQELGILSIENASEHIKEEELIKLWEPFYRGDKSRNSETGGSGLGLYIVKTILDLHRFSYRLENSERGVRFTMEFPVEKY